MELNADKILWHQVLKKKLINLNVSKIYLAVSAACRLSDVIESNTLSQTDVTDNLPHTAAAGSYCSKPFYWCRKRGMIDSMITGTNYRAGCELYVGEEVEKWELRGYDKCQNNIFNITNIIAS